MYLFKITFTFTSLFFSLASTFSIPTLTRKHLLSARSHSSPNPIATLYPNDVTGTINGTLVVIPISYDLARSIIPAQYNILKEAYESQLPGFPHDSYPLVIRPCFDHNVGVYSIGYSLADFQKVLIYYPFVDLLGDGYSSFAYSKYILLSNDSLIAQAGAATYGELPVPARFSPNLEAYAFENANLVDGWSQEIFFDAYTNLSSTHPAVATRFKPTCDIGPWPLEFYVNVTNQPTFSDGILCDNQINLFNTTLSSGKNAPIGITGETTIKAPYIPTDTTFTNLHGIKVDIAFIENNGIPCANLKGYHASGSGD